MAAVEHINTHKAALASTPVSWFEELRSKFTRYRLYRQTVNELSSLSGRELADLGLNRSMIKRVSYQAAYENN